MPSSRFRLHLLSGGLIALFSTAGCGGSMTKPSQIPTCSTPAYNVSALRWETFPIRVYIEEPELARRGYSTGRIAGIRQLITQAVGSWSTATAGQVGAVTIVTDSANSQLNIVFRNNTGNAVHDSVHGEFIRHATILWDIDRWEAFGPPFTNAINGVSFTDGRDHRILNGIAHEMGHVLGVVDHPSMPGNLMTGDVTQLLYQNPQAADVNSILKKYGKCS